MLVANEAETGHLSAVGVYVDTVLNFVCPVGL